MQSDNEQIIIEENNNVSLFKDISKEKNKYIVYDKNNEDIKSFDSLVEASLCFNSKILNERKQIEFLKRGLKQVPSFVTFATILQRELEYNVDEIYENNFKQLQLVYDDYLECDSYKLISKELYELAERYDFSEIKSFVIDYLTDNDIEIEKIEREILDEIIKDAISYAYETNNESKALIWMEDYLQIKVDELKKEEEIL